MRLHRWLLIAWALIGVPALVSAACYFVTPLADGSPNLWPLTVAVILILVGTGAVALLFAVGTRLLLRILTALAYISGMCAAFIVIEFITIVGIPGYFSCVPSETALRNEFASKETKLQKLLRMSDDDRHVTRIAPTFTWLETDMSWPRPREALGFGEKRWDEYRDLFREAEISEGLC